MTDLKEQELIEAHAVADHKCIEAYHDRANADLKWNEAHCKLIEARRNLDEAERMQEEARGEWDEADHEYAEADHERALATCTLREYQKSNAQ